MRFIVEEVTEGAFLQIDSFYGIPRRNMACARVPNLGGRHLVVLVGGNHGSGTHYDVDLFDVDAGVWLISAPALPVRRTNSQLAVVGGGTRVLLLGGEEPAGTPKDTVYELEPDLSAWKRRNDMRLDEPVGRHSVVVYN